MCRGLCEAGADVHPVHFESPQEKEWYYRWFQPDVVVGIGFRGHIPHLDVVSHNFMPYLLAACDIYAAPSRLEGFGMIQVGPTPA